ncbi:hypothetical protein [Maricaulis sp.]|uniref:hypothetical protein n=1 Tax=Maricaulis sp. TaxID=1486257 RepID=UPI002B26BEAE|nr:hypothetical protein [Maricaulis sp.]
MYKILSAGAALVAIVSVPAQAYEVAGGELSFNVGTRYSSVSNIAFLQGGGVTADGDNSFAINAGAGFERTFGQNGRLSLSYGWTSTRYDAQGSRDNELQSAAAVYTHRVGIATLGVSHAQAWYDLDGSSFLQVSSSSAFLGAPGPLGSVLVGRYSHSETELEGGFAFRDAQTDTFGLTAQRQFGATTLQIGVSAAEEDAVAVELDHDSRTLTASLSQPVLVLAQPLLVSLSGSYAERDYDAINPVIGMAREDEHTRLALSVSRSFADGLTLSASVSDLAATSNLPAADYDQSVVSVGVSMNF